MTLNKIKINSGGLHLERTDCINQEALINAKIFKDSLLDWDAERIMNFFIK